MKRVVGRVLRMGVGAGVVAIVLRAWLTPVVIDGGSMAEGLLGPHRNIVCDRCGKRFACASDSLPRDRAVCPNCGCSDIDVSQLADLPGDQVLVNKMAFAFRRPKRWETIVMRCPSDPRHWCVKRVVGLPGETVGISDGDVLVNGKIAHKPLDVLRSMAVLVHDSHFRSGSTASQRWISARQGAWTTSAGGFVHAPALRRSAADQVDWLEYHHMQPPNGASREPTCGPVLDDVSYNQGESRTLLPVRDVLLECRLRTGPTGLLLLRASYGATSFVARIDLATGKGEVHETHKDGNVQVGFTIPAGSLRRYATLQWAVVDGRVLLAMDGTKLSEHWYQPPIRPAGATDASLAIGSTGAWIEVDQLRVYRDANYLPASRSGAASAGGVYQLGDDEYFVLGDNTPMSDDSRTWPRGAVRTETIVGKPVVVSSYR